MNIKQSSPKMAVNTLLGMRRYRRALATLGRILMLYGNRGWQRAQRDKKHAKSAELIAQLCERNGVTWIKAAQFFSNRPDLLPEPYLKALQRLEDTVKPVPFQRIVEQLEKSWGLRWQEHFKAFSPVPVATASIAQVHKAQLTTGEWVAVKVLLPQVRRTFAQDSQVFQWVATVVKPFVKQVDSEQVVGQLLELTGRELDFTHEAAHHLAFASRPHLKGIRVPRIYESLCTSRVLVTEWVQGQRLRDYLAQHPDEASPLLHRLFYSYLQQVTEFGLFQADPHPGNFMVDEEGNVVILDFGAMGQLSPQEATAYQRLFMGLIQGNLEDDELATLFHEAGFVGGKPAVLRELSEYMLTDRLAHEPAWKAMAHIMHQLKEEQVTIPDSYVSISRVLITLGGLLQRYQVVPPWQAHE